jgi:hypothetical protein
MKLIYLAGPVSGRSEKECTLHFYKAADEIHRRIQLEGLDREVDTFNPIPYCKVQVGPDAPWHQYMRHCVSNLAICDGIGLLQGWEDSEGARLELELAGRLKIPVVYIEAPVGTLSDLIRISAHSRPAYVELAQYLNDRLEKWYKDSYNAEDAEERALVETINRYLDPYGFEYLDGPRSETSKEEQNGTV